MKFNLLVVLILLLYSVCLKAQVQNNGNLKMHEGSTIGLFGSLSNNGIFANNGGTLHAVGESNQIFNGSHTIHTNNFTINKANNSLHLDNVLQIAGLLTFTNGSISTDLADIDTEFVEFLDEASYTRQSHESHIEGAIRKTGNDAFVFPTGDNNILRSIGISAPSLVTDHFTCYYLENDPNGLYNTSLLGDGLHHVSACEYWILNRTGGNSDVVVTLSWASNACGVNEVCDLRVSRWDGAQWSSAGNGGVTGTELAGTLASGTSCSIREYVTSFSPFTLGSFTINNPLPISLTSFEATQCEYSVCLAWQTASEVNNDFFTVEKSKDGKHWEHVVNVEGAGNSYTLLNYNTIDTSPFPGFSYYRLKQTDFDGEYEYSSIESVRFKNPMNRELIIYPNPSKGVINIKGISSGYLSIYNSMGQDITSHVMILPNSESHLQLDVSSLAPGIYHIRSIHSSGSIVKQ